MCAGHVEHTGEDRRLSTLDNLRERDHLEHLGIDERTILKSA